MQLTAKALCGATLLLTVGSAAAQSSVTMYGVLDTFVQYLNNGGAASYSQRSGGATGSLFGLRGKEDLGAGTEARFDIETGYNLNNGTLFADTTKLFYRQAWVGLFDEKYGSLAFGRQYQPTFLVAYNADPFALNEVLSPLSAAVLAVDRNTLATQSITGRTSNAMQYQSPNMGGVRLYAMYAFSTTVTQPVPATTGNVLDVAATYTGYGLYAGFAYQAQRPGTETITVGPFTSMNLVASEHYTGALAYRIGIANIQLVYTYARPKDPQGGSAAALVGAAHSVSIAGVGATIQATSVDVVEIEGFERNVRGAHDNTPGVQIGYDHFLSKRTSLYLRAGYMKNNGSAATSWPGIRVVTSTGAADFGASQTLVAVGATHRF
ncbi:porin [Paraburkholderia sp. CNPSo 3272]|uniref:porin n=1 Tax=Paraburkholderia sp. CNPSo 3272 TaxID=2940931 RepID=UPI0020B7E857|nr:porin [Paraburkholderia sp. CNPSo 3272]MCP3728087.1 porin [Paraburkholderia sp. CNPSo 3272]